MKRGTVEWLSGSPTACRIVSALGRNWYSSKGRESLGVWLAFVLKSLEEGRRGKKPVAWTNVFTTAELLHGLDFVVIYPETLTGLVSYLGFSDEYISSAEADFYSADICSFYRCGIGLALAGVLPKPDVVVSSSRLCDGAVKFFHNVSQMFGCPHVLLDVPYEDTPDARSYLADQMENFAREWGFDSSRFGKALELSNQARSDMLRIEDLRRMSPSPLAGNDALGYALNMKFSSPGTETGVEFYRLLREETERKASNGNAIQERVRLMWLHHIRQYYPNRTIDYLEENGARICADEASRVHWPPLDPERAFESLAEKLLSEPSGGPIENRLNLVLALADEYNIDGVIHFSHWGCRQSSGGAYIIRERLQEKGVPLLILNSDGADGTGFSEGQAFTRIDAFLETLEEK
ncbi:MAG: 2-hydroxyacyl-CoA dehydratase subunit D [Dehalococcoidia bacterium]